MGKVTQPQVRGFLKRRGIPTGRTLDNGSYIPFVFKPTPCADTVQVFQPRKTDYQKAVIALAAAGYVFRDYPPAKGYGILVTGKDVVGQSK